MLCTPCLSLKNGSDYFIFEWWLEMQKQIGYEHISICNHSIKNSKEYSKLLKKNQKLITIKNLTCIPNMLSHLGTYFSSNLDLISIINKLYSPLKYDVINELITNECYLDNFENYRFIAIYGIHESIFPKRSNSFSTSDKLKAFLCGVVKAWI